MQHSAFVDGAALKATHKRRSLGDVAAIVAAAPSVTAAARRLQVDRSTVHRWIQAGHASRPTRRPRSPRAVADVARTPEGWARWAKRTYVLNATERQLVDLARRALTLAQDASARPETRLSATSRFQELVKQLDFEKDIDDGAIETPHTDHIRAFPRRAGGRAGA